MTAQGRQGSQAGHQDRRLEQDEGRGRGGDGHRPTGGGDRLNSRQEADRGDGRPGGPAATRETLNVYFTNARSIVIKVDELSCIANDFKPDIILVVETWCHPDIGDALLNLDGYELIPGLRCDRDDTAQGRGGGLLVYAREGISVFSLDNQVDIH